MIAGLAWYFQLFQKGSAVDGSGTDSRAYPEHVWFNFAMGLIHGILFEASLAFSSPTAVLPVFLNQFTGSLALIGLFSAVVKAGGVLPQLIVAHHLQGSARSKRVLVPAIWVRAASWGVLGLFTLLCSDCGVDSGGTGSCGADCSL
jgi:hypothetical protein